MKADNEYSEWITYEQAAALLGCSRKTIQRLVADGKLHPHRRPGHPNRLLPLDEVKALEAPKRIGETPQ